VRGLGEGLSSIKSRWDLRVAALVVGAGLGIVLLTGVIFAVDQARNGDRVARNVSVGGRDVSSASRVELGEALAALDRRYATTTVVVGEKDGFSTDAGTIGLRIDPAATAERVMVVGRRGSLPRRWWSWLVSFRSPRTVEMALSVDREAVSRLVAEKGRQGSNPPAEASIQLDKQGKFVGLAGRAGDGLDAAALADDLLKAADQGTPIRVRARPGTLQPRFTKADADALAKRAEQLAAKPLPLVAETASASLPPTTLRSLISSAPGGTGLELRVDEAAAAAAAEKALADAVPRPVEPTFKIEADNTISFVPGATGRGCCGPEAGRTVAAAVLQRPPGPVPLTLVARAPKITDEQAKSFGIKEEVSSFATKHACCQPRVTNIHRIADIVRGQVIPPGGSFSVNEFVGKRTTEKGFVVDKVIEDGRYEEDVGGGVSQFATTLFNAAWFAGLEFGEYQSHSLAISRYPKGRDATLGFPNPDLVIRNPSPYGVMIWPAYSDRELRVTLYSTKWVDVKANGQDARRNGACTLYTTKRQRTFLDGRVANDFTRAQYRSGEGQLCG
jgi:vancomycin resistance protein YoaR